MPSEALSMKARYFSMARSRRSVWKSSCVMRRVRSRIGSSAYAPRRIMATSEAARRPPPPCSADRMRRMTSSATPWG